MVKQMIFCLETNKRANTDYIYIKEVINCLYENNTQIKISPIYMGTKPKYRSKDVLKVDTDAYEKSVEHANAFREIGQFCEENDYDLIWFCHDVEEVFLGQKVSDSQKVKEAGAYRRRRGVEEISSECLAGKEIKAHTSNILCVLDKYLIRK